MPVYLNKSTGLAESVDKPGEEHEVPLVSPDGQMGSAPGAQVPDLITQGFRQPNQQELSGLLKEAHFNEPTEQIKTGLEGAASGATFGLSTAAERAMGVAPEDITARAEANPGVHALGEAVGVVSSALTGMGEGALLTKAGTAIAGKVIGKSVLSKIAASASAGAIENALFQTGNEVSKFIAQDPSQSAETAIANVGLSGLLGAGMGGSLGATKAGFDGLMESKASQFISDFKGRIQQRLNMPEPLQNVQKEVTEFYTGIKDMADEVYGAKGLKAQDIAKAVPNLNNKMIEQAGSFSTKIQQAFEEMQGKPELYPARLTSKIAKDLEVYNAGLRDARSSAQVFDALQELKAKMQSYSKFDKFVKPVDEAYDFVQKSKTLAYDARQALEDKAVWGKAAERQQAINGAFKEFLPHLEDFERKFTTEVAGERVVDPAKLNTYMNQLGKPNAELKQEMMGNFLDAANKYKQVLDKTHSNLGLEPPTIPSSLSATRSTLEEVTPGAKAADALIKHGMGKLLGTGLGAAVGSATGHPVLGAIIGERALSPSFDTIIPAILKTVLGSAPNGAGLRSSVEYGMQVIKGETKLNNVIKGVFDSTREVVAEPSAKEIEKLRERIDKVASNPEEASQSTGSLGHYMPDHASALGLTLARSTQYLLGIKPNEAPQAPMDSPHVLSKAEESLYTNALKIAQAPLLVLPKVKDGSITIQDIKHLQNLYPALYSRMSEKLYKNLLEHRDMPYKTKMGISMFLGRPLDSSMKNNSIFANQGTFTPMMPIQAGAQMKSSTKTMKMPGLSQLPGQARELYRSTGHR